MIEIERTFLVKNLPSGLDSCKKTEIKQGYFSELPSPLRIRQKDNYFELTKKFPISSGDQSTHDEINLPIKKEEFERLWSLTLRSLEKTRYYFPLENNLMAEIDVFRGKIEGLILVEVEFDSSQAMEKFDPPEWFGKDMTDEFWVVNSFLASSTYKEIQDLISAKGIIP